MGLVRFDTASSIINTVAIEVGLAASPAPFSSTDPNFIALIGMLTAGGRELVGKHQWQSLIKQASIVTQSGDTGVYALPADFGYMIDQTGWNQTSRLPLAGPASAQTWEYLLGRQMAATTVYVQFRQAQGKMWLYPQPPPVGVTVAYEYVSRAWVGALGNSTPNSDSVTDPSDVVFYEPSLISRFVKLKWLTARGMDTTKAQDEWNESWEDWVSKDKAAPVLNLNRMPSPARMLSTGNLPETGYGI